MRSAALAAGLVLLAPGAILYAQQAPTTAARATPVDPYAIPADVRPETSSEAARSEALFAAADGMEARGDNRGAEASLRKGVALFEANWGPRHPVTAIGLNDLAMNLAAQGRFADAEPLHRRARIIREARLGADHPQTAQSLNNLAGTLYEQGRFAEAESLHRAALTIHETRLGVDHTDTAMSLSGLAVALDAQGRFGDAEPLHRRALGINESRLGGDHPDTATSLSNLALNLVDQGRFADAEPLLRRVLAIRDASLGASNSDTATSLGNLASNLYAQGRHADAEPLLRRALAIHEARLVADHPDTATSLSNLASNLDAQARFGDAEPLHRRALTIREARLGADHPDTALSLDNLASNLGVQGRFGDAEPLHRRALAIREARLGADHPSTALSLNNLASNLDDQGRFGEAEPLLRRALAIREARLGAGHPSTALSLNNLASNLDDQGRFGDAEPLLRRALAIREARLGAKHPDTARSLNNLAENLYSQGRRPEAEPLQRRALAVSEETLGLDHSVTATILNNLAGRSTRARSSDVEALLRRALAMREARLGANHPQTAQSLNNLAGNLYDQGRFADAEPLQLRALAIQQTRLGADHPWTALSLENLALLGLRLSKSETALSFARAALRVREGARTSSGAAAAEEVQARLATVSSNAAETFIRAAWSVGAGQPTQTSALRAEAFAAAQVMSVSSSADALAHGAARVSAERAGAGPVVAAWRGAQDRLAAIDAQIARAAAQGAAGDARRTALGSARASTVTQLAAAERDLATRFPRYFDLLKTLPLQVADLQATTGDAARLLDTSEALVLLTAGDALMPEAHRKGLVFVVTKETSAWAEISLEPAALATEIAALHAMLAAQGAGATRVTGQLSPSLTYDRARAFALYRALFGAPEIVAALAGKDRWLIAPQGPLMSLPYAALPMATPPGGAAGDADPAALRTTAWLGLERTLAVLPSVSALRVQRLYPPIQTQVARAPFFGLGDPAFRGVPDADVRGGGSLGAARSYFRGGVADLSAFSRLPRLPNTAREIRALAANLGAGADAYVLQLSASEAELRRRSADGRLARAEVVAFATHGLLAGEFDNTIAEPALALTPPTLAAGATPPAENDGLLTASEAATLSLTARFVILSACNTAAGGKPDADALSGLARAFLYAGAQSLLVSHYPVYDNAAMRLTTEAVRLARSQGLRNPEAMRASMRALQKDTSADASGRSFAHPTAWAPFAVIDAN